MRERDRMTRSMFDHDNIRDAKFESYLAVRNPVKLRYELSAALESQPAHHRRAI